MCSFDIKRQRICWKFVVCFAQCWWPQVTVYTIGGHFVCYSVKRRDNALSSFWPLQLQSLSDKWSELPSTSNASRGLRQTRRHHSAAIKEHRHRSVSEEAGLSSASDPDAGLSSVLSDETATETEWDSDASELTRSTGGSADSIRTAHFSDEGDLSDMDAEVASAKASSAKKQKTDTNIKVLYDGPSSEQLAAAKAASKAPAGPRPLLGDVLSEVIHFGDVKRSAGATGHLDEPLEEEDWRCIMRHKNSEGYTSAPALLRPSTQASVIYIWH